MTASKTNEQAFEALIERALVGATMTVQAFLNWTTIGIVVGGFFAFGLSIASRNY